MKTHCSVRGTCSCLALEKEGSVALFDDGTSLGIEVPPDRLGRQGERQGERASLSDGNISFNIRRRCEQEECNETEENKLPAVSLKQEPLIAG